VEDETSLEEQQRKIMEEIEEPGQFSATSFGIDHFHKLLDRSVVVQTLFIIAARISTSGFASLALFVSYSASSLRACVVDIFIARRAIFLILALFPFFPGAVARRLPHCPSLSFRITVGNTPGSAGLFLLRLFEIRIVEAG